MALSEELLRSTVPESEARAPGAFARVLRGGGWNLFGQFTPIVVALVLTPFVVHELGVERYGLFAIATTVTTFVASFDGGVRASAQRYFSVYAGQGDDARTTRLVVTLGLLVVGLGGVGLLALYALSPMLLGLFGVRAGLLEEGTFLLRILAGACALGLLQGLFTALLNAWNRYALTNTTRVALYLLYAAGVLYSLRQGFGLRGIAVTLLVQSAFSAAVLIPSACRYLRREHLALAPRRELLDFLRYSFRIQLTGLAGLINLQADTFIVAAVAPLAAVGYFSIGANFAAQLRAMPANALGPVQTALGRAYGEAGEVGARQTFERMQRLWVIGSTGLLAVGGVATGFGLLAWLGNGYGLSAFVAVILLAGHLVNLWTGVLTVWLRVIGRPELEARYGIVGMIVNLVLTVAFAISFGVVGVVVATSLAQVLGSLYLLRIVRIRLSVQVRSFLRDVPVVATVAGLLVTVAIEYVVRPVCPPGAVGLAVSGACALPGLVVHLVLAFGWRSSLRLLSGLSAPGIGSRFRRGRGVALPAAPFG